MEHDSDSIALGNPLFIPDPVLEAGREIEGMSRDASKDLEMEEMEGMDKMEVEARVGCSHSRC